jgi:hypothetical protein
LRELTGQTHIHIYGADEALSALAAPLEAGLEEGRHTQARTARRATCVREDLLTARRARAIANAQPNLVEEEVRVEVREEKRKQPKAVQ